MCITGTTLHCPSHPASPGGLGSPMFKGKKFLVETPKFGLKQGTARVGGKFCTPMDLEYVVLRALDRIPGTLQTVHEGGDMWGRQIGSS